MKKKILALLLSVLMVLSCCSAMVVFAEDAEEVTLPENIGVDYEPGVINNAITTEKLSSAYAMGGSGWAGTNATGTFNGETVWTFGTGSASNVDVQVTQSGGWGVLGSSIGTFDKATVLEAGKNVIVSFQANRWYDAYVSGNPNATMNVAIRQNADVPIYSNEYGIGGVEVSNADWQTYTFTFAIPETAAAGDLTLAVGYAYTGIANEPRRGFNIKAGTISVSKEYAYDIDVTADKTKMFAGAGSVTVDADVLNQAGNVGKLSQNVTWYALNDGRTEAADGFTITPGEDGTAQVSAASTVAVGKYTLVAVADENSELVKGITITVADIANDTEKVALADRTDNVITDPYSWSNTGLPAGWTWATTDGTSNGGNYTVTSTVATQDGWNDSDTAKHAAQGLSISKSKSGNMAIYQPGASLVFSASVLSHNTNNPKLTWGIYQATKPSILPIEYPTREDGFVPSNTAWKRFGATVAIPENCDTVGNALFSFGFSKMDAPASGNYAVNINASSMYLAPETAASIEVSADKTSMYTFESINLDAEVYNQIDSKGTVSQNVTWYAMDADRTAVVSGIKVVDGVLTADNTVLSGEYDIVAVSDANSDIVKGITITIKNLSKDFIKVPLSERTDNAITDPTGWGQTGGLTGFSENESANTYTISKSGAVSNYEEDATAKHAAEGLSISKAKSGGMEIYKPGATLVFSASVISHNDNLPKLTWGMYQNSYKSILPMEYPTREEGFEVVADKWTRFGATVAVPEDCDVLGNTLFAFGFSKDTREVTKAVNINRSSMYLAVEAASDIKVTADKTTCALGTENVVTLDADILNQVDYTGNLSQEVTWYAMNEARTEFVDEIKISEGANGTATVTLPATLAAGKYNIVAVSDANKALVRTTTLTVEEAQITETTITSDGTNVTISAKDAISNAILIFAQYDSNDRLLTADLTNNTVTVSTNGTATVAIPEAFKTGNVKIMLWKDLTTFKPLAATIE